MKKCPRSGTKFLWQGRVVTAVPAGHIRGHRSNATCFKEGGETLAVVKMGAGHNRYYPPLKELKPLPAQVRVPPALHVMQRQHDHIPNLFPQPLAPGMNGITEADKAATSRSVALENYREKMQQFDRDEETYDVLSMYEQAALDAGVTTQELTQVQRAVALSGIDETDTLRLYGSCVKKCRRYAPQSLSPCIDRCQEKGGQVGGARLHKPGEICGGTFYNGPEKRFVRCYKCGAVDYEKNEGAKHMEPPRPSGGRVGGTEDFHARNAQIWAGHAVEEAELGAGDALNKGQCNRALESLVRAERKTTMASTNVTQTGNERLKAKARASNTLVNALWREFQTKCIRRYPGDHPGSVLPFGGLGSDVWTDELRAELANLMHLARTALADDPQKRNSRYAWHIWASREFEKVHPEISSTAAYKELERQNAWRYGGLGEIRYTLPDVE